MHVFFYHFSTPFILDMGSWDSLEFLLCSYYAIYSMCTINIQRIKTCTHNLKILLYHSGSRLNYWTRLLYIGRLSDWTWLRGSQTNLRTAIARGPHSSITLTDIDRRLARDLGFVTDGACLSSEARIKRCMYINVIAWLKWG